MRKIKQLIIAAAIVLGFGATLSPVYTGAINAIDDTCSDPVNASSVICKNKGNGADKLVATIVNTLLFLIGVAAVIVIIIGGVRYTLSAGREKEVEEAKNMILYAVIGLVIAFSAYALVNWVLHVFG